MSKNYEVGENSVIDPLAKIGQGVKIGRNVKISGKSEIGDGSQIEDNCIIGYGNLTKSRGEINNSVIIGKNSIIRTNSILYYGCVIGDNVWLGHGVGLREKTEVGNNSRIGSFVWCEGYTKIGSHTTIHAQCHITALMEVGDYVFMGPGIMTTNRYKVAYKRSGMKGKEGVNYQDKGPTVKFGARIGGGVVMMPQTVIGREAFVGAGSLVRKNVPDFTLAVGAPAKFLGEIPQEERLVPGTDFPADHPIMKGAD